MFHFILIFIILIMCFLFTSRGNILNKYQNTQKRTFVFSMILLGALCGLKASGVGNDTHEYIRIFEISENLASGLLSRYEFGFIYYNYLLHYLSSDYQIVFIVSSLLMYISFTYFIWKYSKIPWLSVIIFFIYAPFSFTLSGIRQSLAIAILCFGIHFLINRKNIYFIICVLFASIFHVSSFLFIFCILFPYLKINRKTYLILILISLFSYLFFAEIIDVGLSYFNMYADYKNTEYFEGSVRVASIIQLLFSLLFVILGYFTYNRYFKNIKNVDEFEFRIFYFIILMSTVFSIMSLKVNMIDRVSLYYSVYAMIFVPNTIYFKKSRKIRSVLILLIVIVMLIYTSLTLVFKPMWSSTYPYQFYWFEKT